MSPLKKNILANYLGQGWAAVMSLAFIPLYIRYLGVEAYGLIGLFTVMQSWLTLLDLGISPTLNREMARYTAGARTPQSIQDLLRSLETIGFSIAGIIALMVWTASGYLARDWLSADSLPTSVVARALSVVAFVVALRFVEGIYRGSLYGLQRQVWYNGTNAMLATVRHGGAALTLAFVSPSIEIFFVWQAAVSVLSLSVFAAGVHRALPVPPQRPRFSSDALAGVWEFARGMLGITFLALLLTQVDRVILSRLLSLESFGYYTLATTVTGVLPMVTAPITTAIYPRMVELVADETQSGTLASVYHAGAQLITLLTGPAAMLLCFFAGGVVFMWSGNVELAEHTAPILSALVLGTFLNSLMGMPYQCQLAHGWTGLPVRINVVAVAIFVPCILFVAPRYGALGAAWLWVCLNTGYVLVGVPLLHRRMLPNEKWRWYIEDLLLPTSGSIGVMLLARPFAPSSYQDRAQWFLFLLVTGVLALSMTTVLASRVRARLLAPTRAFIARRLS